MVRLASAFDARESDPEERAFARITAAIAKYWLCKRACMQVGEALECLGGNGFVEESIMPRLYREAPLNSIWEGSGSVICLDILRALAKEPLALEVLMRELRQNQSPDARLNKFVQDLETQLSQTTRDPNLEAQARNLAEALALALQANLMVRYSSPAMAEAFLLSRLNGEHGYTFGTLPASVDVGSILSSNH